MSHSSQLDDVVVCCELFLARCFMDGSLLDDGRYRNVCILVGVWRDFRFDAFRGRYCWRRFRLYGVEIEVSDSWVIVYVIWLIYFVFRIVVMTSPSFICNVISDIQCVFFFRWAVGGIMLPTILPPMISIDFWPAAGGKIFRNIGKTPLYFFYCKSRTMNPGPRLRPKNFPDLKYRGPGSKWDPTWPLTIK